MSHDPLSTLCVSRLTSLLELNCLEDLQKLEDCAFVAHNVMLDERNTLNLQKYVWKEAKKKSFKMLSRKETSNNISGEEIQEEMLDKVVILINHLKSFKETEGLFRISGNKKRQEELKALLNKPGKLNISFKKMQYTPHDIASVLKGFFNELDEPLLTKQLYDCYQQVAGNLKDMDSITANKKKTEALKYLFLLLPPLNRILLKNLLDLLAVVASEETSKMCAYNLGVVFAPSIVCTRKPLCCLTEYAFEVEPFTDLVCFLIENSAEVFKIPEDFYTEAEEYVDNITHNKEKDEVPMIKTFCHKIDSKEFAREAKDHTQDAIMLLYSQMMDMPDGPVKTEFLEKFKQSYPGTPMFVPKSVRERTSSTSSTQSEKNAEHQSNALKKLPSFSRNLLRASVKKAASEPVLNTMDEPGPSCLIATPKCSNEFLNKARTSNISAVNKQYNTPNKYNNHDSQCSLNTPSTPGARVKECFKRIRRRSVEIFKPIVDKPPSTPVSLNDAYFHPQSNSSLRTKVKDVFRRSQHLPNNKRSSKILKKSISTPVLTQHGRIKYNLSSESEENVRKLSFDDQEFASYAIKCDDEFTSGQTSNSIFETPFEEKTGLVNPGFIETPNRNAPKDMPCNDFSTVPGNTGTPMIKKTLYPYANVRTKSKENVLNDECTAKNENVATSFTPVIKTQNRNPSRNVKQQPVRPVIIKERQKVLGDITNSSKTTLV